MATRLQSMGYIPLDFIDENPTMKAFRAGQAFDLSQRRGEAELEQQQRQNEFARHSDPIRLRNIEATTAKNETEAKYADEDERTKLRDRTARTELFVMKAINDRYDAGDFNGGDEIARKTNTPISPEWKASSETRSLINSFDAEAKKRYPDRPAAQLDYIKKGLGHVAQKRQRGEPIDDTAIFDVPGAPEPQTQIADSKWRPIGTAADGRPVYMNERTGDERIGGTSLTPKTSTGRDPAAVATTRHLIEKGIAKSEEEAWAMVQESKSNPVAMRNRVYNETLRATFGNKQKAEEAVADWEKLNKQYRATDRPSGVSAPASPAAPPAAAPPLPSPSSPPRPAPPTIGQVMDGYRFKGGDPSKPESWEEL